MNAATNRDVLNFSPGSVYQISLKYGTGKQISNGRIMFSTVEGEVFFLDQQDADRIYDLQLRPQEPFKLVKQGRNGGIEVERIPQVQQRPGSQPTTNAPAEQSAQVSPPVGRSTGTSQVHDNTLSGIMASSYIAAMDALTVAAEYAAQKGIPFKFTMGELRSSAHCIFIASSRGVTR